MVGAFFSFPPERKPSALMTPSMTAPLTCFQYGAGGFFFVLFWGVGGLHHKWGGTQFRWHRVPSAETWPDGTMQDRVRGQTQTLRPANWRQQAALVPGSQT